MSRIPLIAAVVGALLVGGATTGTTRASWTDTAPMRGDSITAGALDFDRAPLSGSLSVVAGGAAATRLISVQDKSLGKTLTRRIRPTVSAGAGTQAFIYTVSGGTCSTTPAGDFTGVQGASYQLCLSVSAPSGTPAGAVTTTVNLTAQQTRQGSDYGWSVTKAIPVTVTITQPPSTPPEAPTLQCDSFGNNGSYNLRWNTSGPLSYTVYRATTNTTSQFQPVPVPPAHTSPYQAGMPDGTTRFWRVLATNSAGLTSWSNTVQLRRTGNGVNNHLCTEL